MIRRVGAALILIVMCAACTINQRSHRVPDTDQPIVMVLSARLPGYLRRVARHSYLAVRQRGANRWLVLECCKPQVRSRSNPFDPTWGDEVLLHGVMVGDDAARAIECLEPATERYGAPDYSAWPGPNSNTYIERMLRECEIPVNLPPTAVGKDYRGWLGAGVTSEGTGVQIESVLLGLKIGLKEGIEIHILGLTVGIDLWPPAILVPVGTGRWGFDDR